MNVSIDISLYPLRSEYRQPIITFIKTLEGDPEIDIRYNSMSTTLFGDYQKLMSLLENAFLNHLKQIPRSVFIIKISGGCHSEES